MRRVSRSALVPYTVDQMYALVADVESYPDFLPWCRRVTVHRREGQHVEATLEAGRGSISKSFRTNNTLVPNESIRMELARGTFRHLSGLWRFEPIGDAGSRVSLDMEFDFDNRLTDLVFGAFFEDTCDSMVDAFTKRAQERFGVQGG